MENNTIEIRNKNGKLVYKHSCKDNDMKTTLLRAIDDGVDITNCNFAKDDLSGMNVSGINFTDCNFSAANLNGGSFRYCCFVRCNFSCSHIINVDFSFSDFTFAKLSHTNLYNVCFDSTYFYETVFSHVSNYYTFNAYGTSRRTVHCVKHDSGWMVHAGCFWGNLKELRKEVRKTHKSPVYLSNIRLLKKLK